MPTFFEEQEKARRNTGILVILYSLAVAAIILSVYLVLVVFLQPGMYGTVSGFSQIRPEGLWQPELFIKISLGTLFVVFAGSAYKMAQLSSGGEAVATMLGGRIIPPNSTEPQEKKVLNIVEEMAIASGLPVPPVFLLRGEKGINAFAAGLTSKDAVIGITEGCLEQLNRDEIQGVVAHEFSHILNGDIRLNLRLLGVLNGILLLSLIGYGLFRIGGASSYRRSRSRDSGNGAIVAAGLALYVLGYIGVFFANLIKSAVSRQREFLADASAVQFTRNPDGIGKALAKIGGLADGSAVSSPAAPEVSHFFFANGLARSFFQLFSTHPPITERIRRINPALAVRLGRPGYVESLLNENTSQAEAAASASFAPRGPHLTVSEVSNLAGTVEKQDLNLSRELLDGIPPVLRDMAHEPAAARAIIFSMLLATDDRTRKNQLSYLNEKTDSLLMRDLSRAESAVTDLRPGYRLPLIFSMVPALKLLPPQAYSDFRAQVQSMIEMDKQCTLFEFAVQHLLRRHLDFHFLPRQKPGVAAVGKLEQKEALLQLVVSLGKLANTGEDSQQVAVSAGLKELGAEFSSRPLPSQVSLQSLDDALYALEESHPRIREKALKACVAAVAADKVLNVREGELIRAIADGLDCPLPPFLPR